MSYLFGAIASLCVVFWDKKLHKRRTWLFWVFLFLFCGQLGFGLYGILDKYYGQKSDKSDIIEATTTNSLQTQRIVDSVSNITRRSILDSLGLGNRNLNSRLDTLNKKAAPYIQPLIITNNNVAPSVFMSNNEPVFSVAIKSIKAESYIVKYRFLIFGTKGENIGIHPEIVNGSYVKAAGVLGVNDSKTLFIFFNRLQNIVDSYIIVLQVRYLNSMEKVRPAYQETFIVSSVRDLKVGFATDDARQDIRKILESYKY